MNKLFIRLLNKARRTYSRKDPGPTSAFSLIYPENDCPTYEYQGEQAGAYIKKILSQPEPCMISRFGSTEMVTLLTYLNVINDSNFILKCIHYIKGEIGWFWWDNMVKDDMTNCSGFFSSNEYFLTKFGERFLDDIKNIDLLGSWLSDETRLKEAFFPNSSRIPLKDLEPFYHQNPWSEILKEKVILVIHPFEETIQKQYTKRKLLYKDERVLPDFELKTLKTVQSVAGTSVPFSNWFEALDFMCKQIDNIEFDIAIIGAGAYGLPLASYIKQIGKKSVHLGGATQILFGIRGKRWDERPFYQNLANEHWVRPLSSETPEKFQLADSASYW